MANALVSIGGGISPDGNYSVSFEFAEGVDPRQYRARLFFAYGESNDLSSGGSAVGLYAIPSVPGDTVSYDDWAGFYRKRYVDRGKSGSDSSFDVEVSCEFSGDDARHVLEFTDARGRGATLSGESAINGVYSGDNLPVNVLVERKSYSVEIVSARYDAKARKVTVTTATPHGFSGGDAVQVSGFPRGEHSVGVDGERYNGTYAVERVSDTEFSYGSRFFDIPGTVPSDYPECPGATATRWTVVEYSAARSVMCSMGEAIVVWPAHTFRKGDRVTLMDGDTVVARDAVLDMPAPNSFVCRSFDILPGAQADSVVYAPRTPVADVPANYSDAQAPATRTRKLLKKGGMQLQPSLVSNAATEENDSEPLTPYAVGWFDLDGGAPPEAGSLTVGARKFIAFTFMPGSASDRYEVKVTVRSSTEVDTDLLISQVSDTAWDGSTPADTVYSHVSRVPLASVNVNDGGACTFGMDRTFVISGSAVESWGASGAPVSLAITLGGREGAEVAISDEIVITSTPAPAPGQAIVPVSVDPPSASPGDTVTLSSLNSAAFSAPAKDFRIRLNGGAEDTWTEVETNDGEALTFRMPKGYSGKLTVGIMYGDPAVAINDESATSIEARSDGVRVVKLNERLRPGEVSREVNTSAAYNRDLGYVGFSEITDENSMIQNLYSCILTRKGERLFNPEFGTTIEERIFSIRTGATSNAILKECFSVIEQYEPRIRLVYEQCGVQDMGPHGIYLVLGVIVPGGTVRTVSIPFKNRGRLV